MHWLPIQQRIEYKLCTLVFKCQHGIVPIYLSTMCQPVFANIGCHCLRLVVQGDLWCSHVGGTASVKVDKKRKRRLLAGCNTSIK